MAPRPKIGNLHPIVEIQIKRVTGDHPDLQTLAAELSKFLAVLNGENNDFYVQHNKASSLPQAVVAYRNGQPVGCGGFRPFAENTVEIKRMFVNPDVRGTGAGKQILNELEAWAKDLGYTTTVLETSKRLAAATGLYKSAGYQIIENYEPYAGIEDSVCMKKSLAL